jgi:ATP-dependent DNA helicase RecQ
MAGRVEEVLMAAPAARAASPSRSRRRRRGAASAVPVVREITLSAAAEPEAEREPVGPVVEALRAWRLQEARRNAIAPFVILHDRTLLAIASVLPRSAEQLGTIVGIGPAKLATYGQAILDVVASAGRDPGVRSVGSQDTK